VTVAQRKLKVPGSTRRANPEGYMSLVEHLTELRRRVIVSLAALMVGTVIGFLWYQNAPWGMWPLGEIIRGPYCNLPEDMRADFTGNGECRLLATNPFEMFMLRLKVGALAGAVLSSPVWLGQIWGFITPGLRRNEKRYTFAFVGLAVLLFVAGAVLAYFVLDKGLYVLMMMGSEVQIAALTGHDYYGFFLGLITIFGVSFELPLIIIMLNLVGILRYEHVKDKRRLITVGLFIFAAFMTPGQDPYSMIALALSMTLLVEIAFQFCRIHDKRKDHTRPAWMDLDDEESSGPVMSSGSIAAPAPVAASPAPAPAPSPRPAPSPPPEDHFNDVL